MKKPKTTSTPEQRAAFGARLKKFVNNFGNKFYIVQARKALYKFDVSNKEFIQIFNQQVSNLTTYYGKAYFTHQGKLNILNV